MGACRTNPLPNRSPPSKARQWTTSRCSRIRRRRSRRSQPVDTGYTPSGVPTFDSVREKIETRYGTAIGAAELAAESPEGRTVEEQYDARQRAAAERLAEIRKSMHTDEAGRRSVVRFGGQNLGQESVGGRPAQSRPREVPDPLARLR